jgi:hypothetical protein
MPCTFIMTLMIQIEAEYFKKDIVGEFADRYPEPWAK